ncbi:MAG: hypothetical protein IPJ50_02620 [Betaproteobacteria bacterium]|nr:hypothetical protein [Betaproteobacteria bacterium]
MDATKRQQQMRRGVTALRHQFAQRGVGVFSAVLEGADAAQIIGTEAGHYRDRCYPPLTTLRLFIGQVLSEDGALSGCCRAAFVGVCRHRAAAMRTEHRPILPGPAKVAAGDAATAIADGRRAFGIAHAQGLGWRGRHVKLFDGTTVSMPDTPENQRAFPQSSSRSLDLDFLSPGSVA